MVSFLFIEEGKICHICAFYGMYVGEGSRRQLLEGKRMAPFLPWNYSNWTWNISEFRWNLKIVSFATGFCEEQVILGRFSIKYFVDILEKFDATNMAASKPQPEDDSLDVVFKCTKENSRLHQDLILMFWIVYFGKKVLYS